MTYIVWVKSASDHKFYRNGMTFATEAKADTYGQELMALWHGEAYKVTPAPRTPEWVNEIMRQKPWRVPGSTAWAAVNQIDHS